MGFMARLSGDSNDPIIASAGLERRRRFSRHTMTIETLRLSRATVPEPVPHPLSGSWPFAPESYRLRRRPSYVSQGVRVYAIKPMTEHVERSYWPIRWQASVLTAVGVLALLLAAIGLYGVIAYRVARRTQEIGVRMALRTGRLDIFRDVVGQALSIALIGVAVGEVLAVMLTRLLGSLQGDIRPPGLGLYVGTRMI